MDFYAGVTNTDQPRGGGAYVRQHGFGHEAFNFAPHRGRYFGFVQASGSGVNLGRLGAPAGANSLPGVTVVWVAKHPTEGGTRVVGWYRNATAYAQYQDSPTNTRLLPKGHLAGFLLKTDNATRLDRHDREHLVPRGKSGMGQSNIWYPGDDDSERLLEYVASRESGRPLTASRRAAATRLQDVERRQRIELIAMKAAAKWFDDRKYVVADVCMQNLGWDLEARRGRDCLRVEVKGTSLGAKSFAVELTPNEYRNVCDPSLRNPYRICVVSEAESTPLVQVFAWSDERDAWATDDGMTMLSLEEIVIVGARVRPASG